MIKQLTLAIAFFLITGFPDNPVFAQGSNGFAPQDAEWWHNGEASFGPGTAGYEMTYAQVSGDTTIDGIACSKINRIKYSKNEFPDHHTDVDTLIPNAIYVYDNEDTVFVYNENFNRFTPLYVFNAGEGDTVCLPVIGADRRPNPIAGGDTCFCFVIDSVRTVLYDTTYLETFFEHSLADTDSQTPDMWYNDTWPVYN